MSFDLVAELIDSALHNFARLGLNAVEVQARIERAWGLDFGELEDHLRCFDDAEDLLADKRLAIIPSTTDIDPLYARLLDISEEPRPYIMDTYNDRTSFIYLTLPIDPADPFVAYRVKSTTPPHIVALMTDVRIARFAAGHAATMETRRRLIQTQNLLGLESFSNSHTLDRLGRLRTAWTWTRRVPPSFRAMFPRNVAPISRRAATAISSVSEDDLPSDSDVEEDSNPAWVPELEAWRAQVSSSKDEEKLSLGVVELGISEEIPYLERVIPARALTI
uniref:Uncharacterized protein n=1 Tax=Mycena chlorophos TaxID=658473 RepID=A0ABQ0LV27_MYCCL|nr:predicted protein [Mycena chlorophos]